MCARIGLHCTITGLYCYFLSFDRFFACVAVIVDVSPGFATITAVLYLYEFQAAS